MELVAGMTGFGLVFLGRAARAARGLAAEERGGFRRDLGVAGIKEIGVFLVIIAIQ
jgi:hypothetical protein